MAATRGGVQLGIRAKLVLLSLGVIVVGLLGAQSYISRALEHELDARVRDELASRAELTAVSVREGGGLVDPARAQALVVAISRASRARVTLVDPTGRVVADSSVAPDQLSSLENHAGRPEVRQARAEGHGMSDRESDTLHEPLIYYAQRLRAPDGAPWVVRLAVAPQVVQSARDATLRLLFAGGLWGLLASVVLSLLAAQLFSRPVRSLTATARAMVADLSVRTRLRQEDEVGELASALDELADALAQSLSNLEHERDRLEAILEAMVEGVLVTDASGTIVLANHALREMFLVGRDVVGRTPIEAVRNAELHELLAEASRKRAPVTREINVPGVRPRKVLVRAAPIEHGAQGAVAVLSDVTELRRLETVRRDFVANVSHELRTPVAAIRAAVETLEDGALDQPEMAREFVGIIARHAVRLHGLVEDVLELSRIEAKELKLVVERIDTAEALAHAVDLFRLAADGKKVKLAVGPLPADLPPLRADRRALEHILGNLIDNAIKYSPEGAWVTVSAEVHGKTVRLHVRDTGPGIGRHHLPRLFERFYRVDPGRSRQIGGTGLGLAIVKHMAEALQGGVDVESELGRGTVFHVDLPAYDAASAASKADCASSAECASGASSASGEAGVEATGDASGANRAVTDGSAEAR